MSILLNKSIILFIFTFFLTTEGYDVSPKEEVIPKIYEMFKLILEILSDQICGNGKLMFMIFFMVG